MRLRVRARVRARGLGMTCHGLSLACLVATATLGASLRLEMKPKVLCRVRSESGLPMNVWQLGGNRRAVSFGDGMSYESMAYCAGNAPTCEQRDENEVLDDVAGCPDCPCELDTDQPLSVVTESGEAFLDRITARCQSAIKSKPVDVLMLGLGGGTVHSYVRAQCPEATRVRSVEIDPRFKDAAERYFGLRLKPGTSEVVVGDALAVVRREAAQRIRAAANATMAPDGAMGEAGWDIVAVDCFIGGGHMPAHCRNEEFVEHARSLLKPDGVVLHHMWHSSPNDTTVSTEFSDALAKYRTVFGNSGVEVEPVARVDARTRFDDLVIAKLVGDTASP